MKKRHAHSGVTNQQENFLTRSSPRTDGARHPVTSKGTISMVDRIRQVEPLLNRAERSVAQTILASIDRATRSSTKELAKRAAVSEPTIVRFARHVGCTGFVDLKRRISQDIATARMFVLPDHAVISHDTESLAGQVYEATAQALAYSFAQRDPHALEQAASAIDAARRIFCMGTGGSSSNMAQEAENRLFRFDIHATALVDDYKQRIAAAICQAEDVLLVFSVTGRPRALVDCANMARESAARVISVTRPGSPLAEVSDILLPLVIPDNDRRFEIPNRSRYGQLYIMDCLATLVAARRQHVSAPKLRRLRADLVQLHGATDNQPIGD